MTPFRILHCLRAPVGGLFRHVADLAAEQASWGQEIGVICDARPAGPHVEATLRRLADICALGVHRVPMSRQLGLRDLLAVRAIRALAQGGGAHVLHGHGAKGGAYARLAARSLTRRGHPVRAFYTPHGGSLHYDPATLLGRLYLDLERRMAPMTDGLIFESIFSARVYDARVGPPLCEWQVIPNGLWPEEFYELVVDPDAADFLVLGELRHLKGIDVFLQALADLRQECLARALIVGNGPDARTLRRLAGRLNLEAAARFAEPMPARAAFPRARCLVVPSRAESLPYVVLEAAAAGLPLIATNVGDIPEIMAEVDAGLVAPGDVAELKARMAAFLDDPASFAARAERLRESVSERYTVSSMTQAVLEFYARQM